jgi:hypothetical protein
MVLLYSRIVWLLPNYFCSVWEKQTLFEYNLVKGTVSSIIIPMRFLGSHVIHFLIMGLGISLVMGMLKATLRPRRTIMSIRNHALGLIGIGLVLAWIMYLLPRSPIRF